MGKRLATAELGRVKPLLSKIVFAVSCVIALLTLAATGWWIAMIVAINDYLAASDRQWAGWGMIAFIWLVAPVLGGLALLFGVIPGAIGFWRKREHRDLWSLCLSGGCLLALAIEVGVILLPAL